MDALGRTLARAGVVRDEADKRKIERVANALLATGRGSHFQRTCADCNETFDVIDLNEDRCPKCRGSIL